MSDTTKLPADYKNDPVWRKRQMAKLTEALRKARASGLKQPQ